MRLNAMSDGVLGMKVFGELSLEVLHAKMD